MDGPPGGCNTDGEVRHILSHLANKRQPRSHGQREGADIILFITLLVQKPI